MLSKSGINDACKELKRRLQVQGTLKGMAGSTRLVAEVVAEVVVGG